MKIGYHGFAFPEGKTRYNDQKLIALRDKLDPDKFSPFFAEFISDEFVQCDAILMAKEDVLELLIHDIEKCETRLERTVDETERELLRKCLQHLEQEQPLFTGTFTEKEEEYLQAFGPLSWKPTAVIDTQPETDEAIALMLKTAGIMFFYTAGKKEVHAWPIRENATALECAGKIHSDLARGFIKADVVLFDDFISVFNMQEARQKGLVKLVDRDYTIPDSAVIEIRFNV